ncbi:MAG: DUF2894 domain-containing protein [Bacteriovorax sp.]|nr:DUF2894 domain-containing protein [Rhizobacter sp.]
MAALRERGAQRFDPVRFRFIEALARRAAAHGGEVRRILDVRLAAALVEYRGRFDAARPEAGAGFGGSHQPAAMPDAKHSPGPLADLVLHIARHSPPNARVGQADDAAARAGPPAELNALRDFRSTWARLRVDQQLSQSLAKGAGNAGPLNSHLLVLRSLKLMHEISPAYLVRFVAHVDALLWLDQANGGNAAVQVSVARGAGDKKRRPGRGSLQPVK